MGERSTPARLATEPQDASISTAEIAAALRCLELIRDVKLPGWCRTMILSSKSAEEAASRMVSEVERRLARGGAIPDWMVSAFDTFGFKDSGGMDPLQNTEAFVLTLDVWARRARHLGISSHDDHALVRLTSKRDTRPRDSKARQEWIDIVAGVYGIE